MARPKKVAGVKATPKVVKPKTAVKEVNNNGSDTTENAVEQLTCSQRMATLVTDLEKLAKIVRGLASDMKKVKRAHDKELKLAEKLAKGGGRKRRVKDPNAPKRAPSGFNKPGPISPELSKFLGVPKDAEMSRPEVTKLITKYIKANNLQNEANKREIQPDKKMFKLLSGPNDGTPLTFFNLQKYIKHHFPKSATALAAEAGKA